MFDRSANNISLYLKNILSESELAEPATTEEFSVVYTEGRRKASKDLMFRLIINLLAEPQA